MPARWHEWGEITIFSLSGLDGSVAIDGRTVTIKQDSGAGARAGGAKATILTAGSIVGAAVWTGALTGQFSVHYSLAAQGEDAQARARAEARTGTAATSVEYLSVQFKAADKDFWDAMASAIMSAARAATTRTPAARAVTPTAKATAAAAAAKQPTDAPPPSEDAAPPGFDNWLNRTLGLDQDAKTH